MKPFNLAVSMRQHASTLTILFSAAIAVACYLQALYFPLVSDDLTYLSTNSKLLSLQANELWRLFVEPYNLYEFLPLRDLSYWIDITLFGLEPSGLRMTNILLYLLSLPMVYSTTVVLWRYFRPADSSVTTWAPAAVTALFALHPSHVEAVVWISCRKDLLSGMFSLLAMWLAVHAKIDKGFSSRYAGATLLALLAAMLSKASAVAVVLVIAMIWLIFWRDIPAQYRRRSQLLWPLSCLILAVVIALVFMAHSTIKLAPYFGFEAISRVLAVQGWLVRLAISPENRHYLYPVLDNSWLIAMEVAGALVFVAFAGGMMQLLRKGSLEYFAIVVFALLCLPYLQLIPYVTNSIVADRFVYLAVWPASLLIVSLVWHLKHWLRVAVVLFFLLASAFQTLERTPSWRSLEALIEADYIATPGNYQLALHKIFYFQLPQGLYNEANATANNVTDPEAREILVRLVEAKYALQDAAIIGSPQTAISLLRKLGPLLKEPLAQAKWNPPMFEFWMRTRNYLVLFWQELAKEFVGNAAVNYSAGMSLFGLHQYDDAADRLQAAVSSPQLPESLHGKAYVFYGSALLNSGHPEEAEIQLRKSLEKSPPDFRAYCVLAEVYKQTSRFDLAELAEANCLKYAPKGGIIR